MKATRIFIMCMIAVMAVNAQVQNRRKGIVEEVKYSTSSDKKKFDYYPLSGVQIKMDDGTGDISDRNGMFELFPKKSQTFRLVMISMNNYDLIVPTNYTQLYTISSELLRIVMVKKETRENFILNKKADAEIPIEEDKLKRKKELKDKKDKGIIDGVEYSKQLKKIEEDYSMRLEQMNDFIDKYSYDYFSGVEEEEEMLYDMIIEGRFDDFDSVMGIRGDYQKRKFEIQKLAILEKTVRKDRKKRIEKLAKECYLKSKRYEQEYLHDSSLFYMLERYSLDTNNADWIEAVALKYKNLGKYTESLEWNNRCRLIREKVLPSDHPDLASIYNNIGTVYGDLGNYTESLKWLNECRLIREKVLPSDHPDLASIYNNIGSIYRDLDKYTESLEWYNKCRLIREKVLPFDHPDLAAIYNNIGLIYSDLCNYAESLEWVNKCRVIQEKIFPSDHLNLALTYNNIGSIYRDLGKYTESLEWYNKCRVIREKVLPSEHPDLATIYKKIGILYNKLGNYTESLEWINKYREINEKKLPFDHPNLATIYNNIGILYNKLGNYTESLEWYNKALTIYVNKYGEDHDKTKEVKQNIEEVKQKMKEE